MYLSLLLPQNMALSMIRKGNHDAIYTCLVYLFAKPLPSVELLSRYCTKGSN